MAPAVKGGKVVSGTPAPSAGGTAAATSTAARSAGSQKREAAPPPPPPASTESTESAPPATETSPAPMMVSADRTASQYAREKRDAMMAAQPRASGLVRGALESATTSALAASSMVPGLQTIPAQAMLYKAYTASPEAGTYAVGKLASAARSAQEAFGSDLGLTRVAQLAREYLPQSRQAEYQTESPRPSSRAAQSGAERIFVPQTVTEASPRDLSSVAEFRKFYETKVENLADMRRRLAEKDEQIRLAPDTTTDADMKKLAQERAQIKQYETDYRASLLRAGFSDAEINALVRGEVPGAR